MFQMTVITTENPNALTDENVQDIIDTLNENVKSSENLSNIVAFPSNNGVEEHEPEEGYENPDGTPFCVESDFYGTLRPQDKSMIGPFQNLASGPQTLKLWDL